MSAELATVLQIAVLVAALVAAQASLGDYMARVFTSDRHWRVERLLYRLVGVDPSADQRWTVYLRSLLAFSAVSAVLLYAFLRLQPLLPLDLERGAMPPDQAFNTAISFVTNTNWQSYSGEAIGHLVQMAGLAVQNFLSAAVGLAVLVALIRGISRTRTDRVGNFWVDVTRGTVRILLPLSVVAALVMVAGGVVQNFTGVTEVSTLTGGAQSIPGGPVASQEAIKELGTNGGGFFNANSSHPFEGPTAWISLLQVFLLLVIPFSAPRMLGRMLGDLRQGVTILAVMGVLWLGAVTTVLATEFSGFGGVVGGAEGEGRETRIGTGLSAVFAVSTTATSTGSVNSFHSSYSPIGGGVLTGNMLLTEVSPGGVGVGLYGLLLLAVVAVFLAGLMVGRTPELLGKKIGPREMKIVSLVVLTVPALVLLGTGLALALPESRDSILNGGPHGLTEVLYAFASASNNNGSAFAGLSANTPFYNVGLGIAMLLGRFVPIVLVLALAGSLAGQQATPRNEGTLPTNGPQFVVLLTAVVLIVAGLTFLPALALGPIAEATL